MRDVVYGQPSMCSTIIDHFQQNRKQHIYVKGKEKMQQIDSVMKAINMTKSKSSREERKEIAALRVSLDQSNHAKQQQSEGQGLMTSLL